ISTTIAIRTILNRLGFGNNIASIGVGDSEGSPCVKGRSRSVRSAVPLSLHQNGLSIDRSAVFATCGSARPADTSLNMRLIYRPANWQTLTRRQQLRQLGNIGGNPSRLIFAE